MRGEVGEAKPKGRDKGAPPPDKGEEKEYILIQELWTHGTDSIHNMRVVNTDAISYQSQPPEKCLETAENEKKKKYLHACLNKRWDFTPFFASVEGLLEVKAEATLKHIAICISQNWKEPYSCKCRYVKSILAINLVRATHHCIWGARVPAYQISVTRTQCEDGAGLHISR